ncbi:MAG: hypothetical protein MUF48_10590 [Pirellulaceae bacterium]|nr:hypothetical protein [Pirellulaceae bacterium]
MPQSVLDAIKSGKWDYEPEERCSSDFASTRAMPGSFEKVSVLSDRVSRGLPLWHPLDRRAYDEGSD